MLNFSSKVQHGRMGVWRALNGMLSEKSYDINAPSEAKESLPPAPRNPWRKTPVKLQYDRQEYHMFNLPSEQDFLMGPFDSTKVFGRKPGREHSKQTQQHINLDNNLVFLAFAFAVISMFCEFKDHENYHALRKNFYSQDMGRFSIEDFK